MASFVHFGATDSSKIHWSAVRVSTVVDNPPTGRSKGRERLQKMLATRSTRPPMGAPGARSMRSTLLVLAVALCASVASAQETPLSTADSGSDGASAPNITRRVALWTHGITGAAPLVGGADIGARGLQTDDADAYEEECKTGALGGCQRFEATAPANQADRAIAGAMLLHSFAALSGLVFLGLPEAPEVGDDRRLTGIVLYSSSAAPSLITTGFPVRSPTLRADLTDAKDACFQRDFRPVEQADSDVSASLRWPRCPSAASYTLSVGTNLWLGSANNRLSLLATLDSNYQRQR